MNPAAIARSSNPRLRRDLERLLHVLLTHSENATEGKVAFCRRCAWDVECIIDELENPTTDRGPAVMAQVLESVEKRRRSIFVRQQERNNDDWG
jgi:hypothetical protein